MRDFAHAARHWAYLALAHLGWRHDDFWQATPSEIRMALEPPDAANQILCSRELKALIARDAQQENIYG